MSWMAPRTWVYNEIVSAPLLNTYLRDDLLETAPAKAVAAGDIFYATAQNQIARLPIGAANKFLRVNAAQNAPEWGGQGFARAPIYFNGGVALLVPSPSYIDVVAISGNFFGHQVIVIDLITVQEAKSASAQVDWGHRILLDGVVVWGDYPERFVTNGAGQYARSMLGMYASTPAAGVHTWSVQSHYNSASSSAAAQAYATLLVLEIG